MRTATVVGIALIGLGIITLAYFMSPLGFLLQAGFNQQQMNLVPAVLGAIALVSGIALLVAVWWRVNKNKSEP
jgi:membrane protein DedA with SNARE-associated domain